MRKIFAGAVALAFPASLVTAQGTMAQGASETVIVNADTEASGTSEGILAAQARARVNVADSEDALKYLPSLVLRKRHIGDTQAVLATRTSGVGSSARSLVYADGILLSPPIGNNNSFASPRWGMVAPEDIARIDVLYGPYSARYSGNAVGAVVDMTTRAPTRFSTNARVQGAVQDFSLYGSRGGYASKGLAAGIEDRIGDFGFRASVNQLFTDSQPLSIVTLSQPGAKSGAGTPVTGAFADRNRTGAPIAVVGAGGFEHQEQTNLTTRLTYDILPDVRAAYVLGLFHQDNTAQAETYLRDGAGNPVYSGTVNIDGYAYAVPASAISNGVYRQFQTHLMQGLTFGGNDGAWTWNLRGSRYDYLRDAQRAPTGALPSALAGGAGSVTRMDGTGWQTIDAEAAWRGDDLRVSAGVHGERSALRNVKTNTSDWLRATSTGVAGIARGKSATEAAWAEAMWSPLPDLSATLGGRYENWSGYDGYNFSSAPVLSVAQPRVKADGFSPKLSLNYEPGGGVTLSAAYGRALRMPTVSELYQTVTTGATLSVPNPNLRPERADSLELAAAWRDDKGRVRVSLFAENMADALISQSAPLVAGSTQLYNYVQNIDRVRTRGIEIVAERNDVLFDGLSLSGNLTWVDSHITRDTAFAPAVGKRTPQIPTLRATLAATYQATERMSVTLAGRYGGKSYATIDNSDTYSHTWQGFDAYFVADVRMQYILSPEWTASFGVDNINNRKYFLFHPFPQRTFMLELRHAN